jgi:hypothetical protein
MLDSYKLGAELISNFVTFELDLHQNMIYYMISINIFNTEYWGLKVSRV